MLDAALANIKGKCETISMEEFYKQGPLPVDLYITRIKDAHAFSNGATAILDDETIKNLHDIHEGDFYILPSSIHEVITVAKSDVDDEKYLKAMVELVNANELLPEDILTNSVYICHNGKIEVVK